MLSTAPTDMWKHSSLQALQAMNEATVERQRGILAAIIELELHQRVFETDGWILPVPHERSQGILPILASFRAASWHGVAKSVVRDRLTQQEQQG